jgi:large subunit ribosomal protein L13
MKTFIPKVDPSNRKWWVIDLEGETLGRVAVKVADILRGKNKPTFTPHLDTGDHVVVINASGVKVTGNKEAYKAYYKYSGYPGGLKKTTIAKLRQERPEEVFRRAVKRMLPKNRLARQMFSKLHVYAGTEHPHIAQQPVKLELK